MELGPNLSARLRFHFSPGPDSSRGPPAALPPPPNLKCCHSSLSCPPHNPMLTFFSQPIPTGPLAQWHQGWLPENTAYLCTGLQTPELVLYGKYGLHPKTFKKYNKHNVMETGTLQICQYCSQKVINQSWTYLSFIILFFFPIDYPLVVLSCIQCHIIKPKSSCYNPKWITPIYSRPNVNRFVKMKKHLDGQLSLSTWAYWKERVSWGLMGFCSSSNRDVVIHFILQVQNESLLKVNGHASSLYPIQKQHNTFRVIWNILSGMNGGC